MDPLSAIAERTGFQHVEYLSVVFKRETKMTPGRYRAQAKGSLASRIDFVRGAGCLQPMALGQGT